MRRPGSSINMQSTESFLDAGMRYVAAGLRVLPACPTSKRPTLSRFKPYRTSPPTEHQHQTWFSHASAICVLTGETSGNLEVIDFDQRGRAFDAWCSLVSSQDAALLDRLVVQQTQSGGRHVAYRIENPGPGSTVLARTTNPDEAGKDVLIETRGEGGLIMCDPSPGYRVIRGDLAAVPTISMADRDWLIKAARSLNEAPNHSDESSSQTKFSDGTQPGDDFNDRGDVAAILVRHGWRLLRDGDNQQWCRPGKTEGCSATLKDGAFFIFSSNASPFDPNRAYAPFAVYALLEHNGDFASATRALADEGYGKPAPSDVDLSQFKVSSASGTPPPSEPPNIDDPGTLPDSMLHVPGFVAELMEHCLDTAPYPNPTLAFCGALALQAMLAGRRVRDPGDNRTNLYLLGLAHSAAGKDWPRKLNTRILHQVGLSDCIGERFASGEGIQDALHLTPSMLFQTDEIDGMLQSMNKSSDGRHENILSTLLTMYSSANSVYPMRRKAGKESPGAIDQPSLVIFGTAIPNHYYEALSERMLTNGFFARMMILECGQRGRGQEPKIADVPDRIMVTARWWAKYEPGGGNLGPWHPRPAVVPHTEDARRLLVDARYAAEVEYDKAELKSDSVGTTVWGRVNEQTRKLALLYAISANCRDPVINAEAARWAIDIVNHLTRRMLFMASSHVAENPFHADCLRLITKLRQAPEHRIAHSVLLKRMKMDARTFRELIITLEQSGDVSTVTSVTPGRPSREYQLLNPESHEPKG